MVEFGGWDMPVEYTGIADEHMAVRTLAGVFDVSHMGEIEIAGKDALAAVQRITSNDASKLADSQAQYAALMTPEGTFVDDVLTYRLNGEHFMLVVNASNIIKDFNWISARVGEAGDAVAVNTSSRYALIAVQGPVAREVLQTLTSVQLDQIKYYWFTTGEVAATRVTISRTGYTGEDGFEIFVQPAMAERVWDAVLRAGQPAGIVPAGLGARDTLRLEAGMRLYGNDIDEGTTLVEAGLGWIVSLDAAKGDFIGRAILEEQKRTGAPRKLVGCDSKRQLARAAEREGGRFLEPSSFARLIRSRDGVSSLAVDARSEHYAGNLRFLAHACRERIHARLQFDLRGVLAHSIPLSIEVRTRQHSTQPRTRAVLHSARFRDKRARRRPFGTRTNVARTPRPPAAERLGATASASSSRGEPQGHTWAGRARTAGFVRGTDWSWASARVAAWRTAGVRSVQRAQHIAGAARPGARCDRRA